MGWSLAASAGGNSTAAVLVVVGAILLVLAWFCFRGVELFASFGANVGDGMCVIFVLAGLATLGFGIFVAVNE